MKKVISLLLAIMMVFSIGMVFSYAEDTETTVTETVEYFEDGSYLVTTLIVEENSVARATSTKSGYKTATIYNSNDVALVTLKLSASFSYTGSSATCTSASTSYTIHNDNWKVTSATATKSSNKAIGDFTSKKYFLGIAIQTINSTITITCSNTGSVT